MWLANAARNTYTSLDSIASANMVAKDSDRGLGAGRMDIFLWYLGSHMRRLLSHRQQCYNITIFCCGMLHHICMYWAQLSASNHKKPCRKRPSDTVLAELQTNRVTNKQQAEPPSMIDDRSSL